MKKKILFVNESLALAGGEKSLIALLSSINASKYDIDLQLFSYGEALEEFVPQYVNILPEIPYTKFTAQPWKKNFLSAIISWEKIKFLFSKLRYSLNLRKGTFNHPEKAQIYWESVADSIKSTNKIYDIAIAYAQGIPTYYVIDKVKVKRKIAWVNTNVIFPPKNKLFQEFYYRQYDTIVAVSDVTKKHLNIVFPELKSKYYTIYDMIDYKSILKMASLNENIFNNNTFNILTVSRLNQYMKGFDITLEVCKILKERGVKFHWWVLGEGSYRKEIEQFVEKNQLESYFTLLGTTSNPYPYFKNADLYVQTSRKEGYGLSIAEARLLNLPVVTTRFDAVFMQMKHGKNGLVVDINAVAVADAIEELINNKKLYNDIVAYQKEEKKGNSEELNKFYNLVDNY